jgi:hypothetical protein
MNLLELAKEIEELKAKADAFDDIYAYLKSKAHMSQHDADEFYAVRWLMQNRGASLFDAPFDIASFEEDPLLSDFVDENWDLNMTEAEERRWYLLEKERVSGLDKAELHELTSFGSEEE